MPFFYSPRSDRFCVFFRLGAAIFFLVGCAGRPQASSPIETKSKLERSARETAQSCQPEALRLVAFQRRTEREFSRLLAYFKLLEHRLHPYQYLTQRGEIFSVFTAHHLDELSALERALSPCLPHEEFLRWRTQLAKRLEDLMGEGGADPLTRKAPIE